MDIRDILTNAGIEWKDKGINVGQDFVNVCCPFCEEERFHCGIHQEDRWFKCFVCGKAGNSRQLSRKLGVDVSDETLFLEKVRPPAQPPPIDPNLLDPLLEDDPVYAWLTSRPTDLKDPFRCRCLSPQDAMKFYRGKKEFNGYAVLKEGDNLIGRSFTPQRPLKWKKRSNSPTLLGAEDIKLRKPEVGVIVEGAFDMLRLPTGVAGAVLTANTPMSVVAIIEQAFPNGIEIVIALDKTVDRVVVEDNRSTLEGLGFKTRVANWKYPDAKDLDEVFLLYGQDGVSEVVGFDTKEDETPQALF